MRTRKRLSLYAAPGKQLTDTSWKREDLRNASLCIELRRALKEVDRCAPQKDLKP